MIQDLSHLSKGRQQNPVSDLRRVIEQAESLCAVFGDLRPMAAAVWIGSAHNRVDRAKVGRFPTAEPLP